ncbi:MAG: C39 family peptidase [Oscillochloridaceae bacterium umkhey_bin13]
MQPVHQIVGWDADAIACWERVAPTSADDPQARIALLSPTIPGRRELIVSWAAETPAGSWIELQVRVGQADQWGRWFRLAAWDSALSNSRRSSFADQRGPDGHVATDTLMLTSAPELVQARVLLCAEPGADMPELEALTICASDGTPAVDPGAAALPASTVPLPVLRSQYSYAEGTGWCSPTAVTMVLAAWYAQTGDPRLAALAEPDAIPTLAAPLIHDPAWEGTGNWAFNVAFAASRGLTAYVTRFERLEQLACWTATGVPVIVSLAWQAGEITDAPGATNGHLTIVRGFAGDRVLIAEPASPDEASVLRAYPADQFFAAWQRTSAGTVYLIYPPAWSRPEPGANDAWI